MNVEIESVNVEINFPSLEVSNDSSITGEICLSVGDNYFPEKNWNDFVIVLLNMWCEAFFRIEKSLENSVEFRFMDGPFFIRCQKHDDKLLEMEFFDGRKRELAVHNILCEIKQFKNSILDTSKRIINLFKNKNFRSRDLVDLEKKITGLAVE